MKTNSKKKKAIDLIGNQPTIEFPYHVMRFFVNGSRQITFSNELASFGEDYGSVEELRECLDWIVDQFGGTVKWSKK